MSQIKIQEIDNTTSPANGYANNTILIFGPKADGKTPVLDENDAIQITSQTEFVTNIGKVDVTSTSTSHCYGNQMAYLLSGIGYTIIYCVIDAVDTITTKADAFADKSAYDFRFICSGMDTQNTEQSKAIAKVANARGDCVAVCDIDYTKYMATTITSAAGRIAAMETEAETICAGVETTSGYDSKYIAFCANRPTYKSLATDTDFNNAQLPTSFQYLACFGKMLKTYPEYFAASGFDRGVSDFTIEKLELNRCGDSYLSVLQPRHGSSDFSRAINILCTFRGNYYFWGNRTAAKLTVNSTSADSDTLKASHFLSIRHLCTTIKKNLYIICKELSFDPNDAILWSDFTYKVSTLLDNIKANQGIDDYIITKVIDNKKGMLTAIIRIVPIEPVEDFDITLSLEDSLSGEISITDSLETV